MTLKLQALIVGESSQLIMATAGLLSRSGFSVDVASTKHLLKHLKVIRNFFYIQSPKDLAINVNALAGDNYDLVVVADDPTLKKILDSNLSIAEKLKLLPVIAEQNLKHIGSKTELSNTFREAGVRTPNFMIVQNSDELLSSIAKIGFPMMLKIDFSGGGTGVFECTNRDDLISAQRKVNAYPVLVQNKIEGVTTDLSGLFQNGALIYFSYAVAEEVCSNQFGPSVIREYKCTYKLHSELFDELSEIGRALGANGFVNVGCIESSSDNNRYYFEADMRPTVWVEYPKYLQDDPALKINDYFNNGKLLTRIGNKKILHANVLLPYLPRMHWLHIVINRYQCWHYFNNYMGFRFLQMLLYDRLSQILNNSIVFINVAAVKCIKPYVPKSTWALLRQCAMLKNLRPCTVNACSRNTLFTIALQANNWIRFLSTKVVDKMCQVPFHLTHRIKMRFNSPKIILLSHLAPAINVHGKIAIHVHVHYCEQIEAIADYLSNMPFEYDLYVSVTSNEAKSLCIKHFNGLVYLTKMTVEIVPNRGRNVAALICTFSNALLQYDYIGHFHTKKSAHLGNHVTMWGEYLYEKLLGSEHAIRCIFTLMKDPNCGIVYPKNYSKLGYAAYSWMSNKKLSSELAGKLNLTNLNNGFINFPAGFMFWAKIDAVRPILTSGLDVLNFEEELGQLDGTLSHSIERLMVFSVMDRGYKFAVI